MFSLFGVSSRGRQSSELKAPFVHCNILQKSQLTKFDEAFTAITDISNECLYGGKFSFVKISISVSLELSPSYLQALQACSKYQY